ncbi:hypothetical protein IWX81_001368 [Salinibacterium sp. CAN_S4]|uniref:hypothetical protein n=1 Tax=Salinibacterium sp. CAN_S4 TaxID=2787727 RepID=UPI0018EF8528
MILPETVTVDEGLTVVGASPELLEELLDFLDVETTRLGVSVRDALLPGLARQQVQDEFGAVGLQAPEELITWWGWSNGVRPGVMGTRSFEFNSLQTTLGSWSREVHGSGNNDGTWNPEWLRVLGPGNYGVLVSCAAVDGPPLVRDSDGALGTAVWDTDNQVVSLCTPVTWWIHARQRGWTTWTPAPGGQNEWMVDWEKFPLEWRLTQIPQY